MSANFISQTSLATLPKINPSEEPARVIMTDFTVFHDVSNNSGHFAEPTNSEDERQEYLEGFEAGKTEAAGIYDATIKVMEQTLEQLKTSLETQVKEVEASHSRVIVKCLEAVLPETAKRVLLSEMAQVLQQAAESDIKGRIIANLHPDNTTAKDFLLTQNSNAFEIVESDNLNVTDVTFMWGNTRVELNPIEAAQRCLSLLNEAIGMPMPATQITQDEVIS